MKTYWRMIKMVKPYLGQLVLAMVCMIIFSFMSVFSASMISPFLQALFSEELAAQESSVLQDMPGTPGAWEEAGVVHEGAHPESARLAEEAAAGQPREGDPSRQRYEDLRARASGLESLKYKFKDWVDDTLLKGSKQDALLRIVLTFFFLALLKNIFCYLQEVLMVYVSQVVVRDLRNQLFVKMTAMPLSFYHQHKGGELISRATNDVLIAQQCISASFSKLVKEPFLIIGFLGVALILSWKLTLIALTLMPVSMIVIIRIGKRLRHLSHKQQEQMADLTSTLQETVYGIRVVKAFAMEDFENRKFLRQSHDLFRQIFRINYVMKLSSPLTEQLMMVVGLFLLWYGGSRIFTGGAMAPDLFIVFLFMIFSMVRPFKALGTVNNDIQSGMAAAERIFAILDAEPEVTQGSHTKSMGRAKGDVEFDHVHFEYLPGEPVLKDVSLKVSPGEVVALVGSSGSGKSTLIDLIPGFHHPDQGRVVIDGNDVTDLDLTDLRRNMGIVTQEVILFHDSGAQQHRLRIVRCVRRGHPGGGEGGQRRRVHRQDASGVRYDHRRSGTQAVRGTAAAHQHCAGDPQEPGYPVAGRGHQRPRHRGREAGPGSHRPAGEGPHDDRHRAPAVHHPERRPHLPARRGQGRADRHPHRTAGGRRPVQGTLHHAVREVVMAQYIYTLKPARPEMLTEGVDPGRGEGRRDPLRLPVGPDGQGRGQAGRAHHRNGGENHRRDDLRSR